MKPIPRHWTKRMTFKDPSVKPINPQDRIKYWNIVPGDQISLLGDRNKALHEVLSINKLTNRVYLKGAQNVRWQLCVSHSSTNGPYRRELMDQPVHQNLLAFRTRSVDCSLARLT
jgi:hypothetical protein